MPPSPLVLRMLAAQLSHPRGLAGRVVGALMNHNNRRMNAYTLDAIAPRIGETVVDVGFGGGLTLRPLADRVGPGHVIGVEKSDAMIARARREHASLINAGRLRIERGTIESIPVDTDAADAICTVNTVYFWKDHEAAAQELARVVRPGGRVAITFLPKDAMEAMGFPPSVFRYTSAEEIETVLRDVGFVHVRTDLAPEPNDRWCCVRGVHLAVE